MVYEEVRPILSNFRDVAVWWAWHYGAGLSHLKGLF